MCVVRGAALLGVIWKWIFPPRLFFSLPASPPGHIIQKKQHNSLLVLALLLRREIQGSCCHTLPPSSSCVYLPECFTISSDANCNLNNRSFTKPIIPCSSERDGESKSLNAYHEGCIWPLWIKLNASCLHGAAGLVQVSFKKGNTVPCISTKGFSVHERPWVSKFQEICIIFFKR